MKRIAKAHDPENKQLARGWEVGWYACDHCKKTPFICYDEDETRWCAVCIDNWERTHKASWATGYPLVP